MFRGLTGRIVAAGLLLLLLVGGGFAGLFLAINELQSADAQVSRSESQLEAANRIERLLVDLETGLRGFVITREERFLEPWNAARDRFPRDAGALAESADVADQMDRAQAVVAAGGAYIEEYGVPLIDAVRNGEPSASSTETTELGKQRVDEIRFLLAEFIDAERRTYTARQAAADNVAGTATAAATVAFGASVALIATFVAYLARTMVRPVINAAGMARRLAAGDLSARMPETGTAEIGTLERSFNSLAASLNESQVAQARLLEQQSALRRVATLVAEARNADEVFRAVVREVGEHLPAEIALLDRYEPDATLSTIAAWIAGRGIVEEEGRVPVTADSVPDRVRTTRTTVRMEPYHATSGVAHRMGVHGPRSLVGCPVIVSGTVWGILAVSSKLEHPLPLDAESWMTAFTELVGTAIANVNARAELTASRARIVTASDDTRRRIERNLHDGAQQRLVSLGLMLRTLESKVPDGQDEIRSEIHLVTEELTGVIEELREISRGIYPASLSRGGLASAVRTLARRSPLAIRLDLRTEAPLSEPVQAAGYYVVAEAVTNATKHASASEIQVTLEDRDGTLRVSVQDDGVGGADPIRGSGLIGLRDRVEALGGRLEVTSAPGAGTSLVAEIPNP
jgi:signal transduction histidine kinase